MTTDTSREAVEALIADLRLDSFGHESPEADTLVALLDERDRLENSLSARDVELQQDALRIRDLEATVDNLRLISNANGDWNIKYQEVNHRAERAEADRERFKFALETSEEQRLTAEAEVERLRERQESSDLANEAIRWKREALDAEAERDKLTAALADETKRADENYDDMHEWRSKARKLAAKLDAVKALVSEWERIQENNRVKLASDGPAYIEKTPGVWRFRAILADTNEGSEQ